MRIIVTGGAGFIGSALVLHLVHDLGFEVLTLDALTYAANPASLEPLAGDARHAFLEADIRDGARVQAAFAAFKPDAVMHLAAESHVDRSITGPGAFIRTNVLGTQVLLDAARAYWERLPAQERDAFRFLHVSTDEVFGSLGPEGYFTEQTRYDPRSPYSASKAASDHLVRAWGETYGLPILVSNCSNNYGPRQFPEKLIPLTILNALEGKELPIYGDGLNRRDWLHVEDHVRALVAILTRGRVGQTYAVGGRAEHANRDVVTRICAVMDALSPKGRPHERLIRFVADRPGHDRRYAIDCGKIETELGWRRSRSFEDGLRETVAWYLHNRNWWRPLRDQIHAGERLGVT